MPNLKNVLQIVVEIDRGGRPLALKQDYIKICSPWLFNNLIFLSNQNYV